MQIILEETLPMLKKEWLNNPLAKVVAIFSVFFTKPNKVKKTLEFSLLKVADDVDETFIISTFILSKFLLSKSLSEPDFISSKFIMYWAAFLSKYWL